MNAPMRLMGYMARSNPSLLVRLIASQMMKSDRALINQPETREVLSRSVSESFRFGARGAITEGELLVRPWGFDLGEINMVVNLWHREVDTVVPPQMSRHLAWAIPSCESRPVPGEGHMLVFSHWADILSSLVS